MATRQKIDSNETSAFYAQEESIGVLPVTPIWYPLEPNSYDDFGGELTLLARNPINSSRQRKKGVITDLDASGGINQDFTQENFQDLLQGFMFARHRNKTQQKPTAISASAVTVQDATAYKAGMIVAIVGSNVAANNKHYSVAADGTGTELPLAGLAVDAAPRSDARISVVGYALDGATIDVSGVYPKLVAAGVDFVAAGLTAGEWIYVGGDGAGTSFTDEANNGFKRISVVEAGAITFDMSFAAMVTAAATDVQIYVGRVLKNELGDKIIRHSYQIERQIGAPDTANLSQVQSEYLVGAVPNEFVMNIETADKINADMSFVAMNNEQRTAVEGIKAGTRMPLIEADAFNTSSDFSFILMNIVDTSKENPEALFSFLTEMSVTINNNVQPNKAVAVLGAFDMTAGTFEVSAEAGAYFSRVEAVQAVRNNADVGLSFGVVKNNSGFICDMPLVALGDARLEIELNEPIMLPLDINAATAAKINPNTDHTLLWVFFDYLPNRANA